MDEDLNNISAEIIDAPQTNSPVTEALPIPTEGPTDTDEDTSLEKKKKPRSEAQKKAFARAQQALKEKRELKKKEALLNKKPRGRPPKKKPEPKVQFAVD